MCSLSYLEFLRRQRGLRQEQLAHAAGISQQMLSAIERRTKVPSDETLELLSRTLGVHPPSALMKGVTAIPEQTPGYQAEVQEKATA